MTSQMSRRQFVTTAAAATAGAFALGAGILSGDAHAAGAPKGSYATLTSPTLGTVYVFQGTLSSNQYLVKTSGVNVRGAMHDPNTADLGALGVAVVAGHRTTWPRPFLNLDRMTVGEIITTVGPNGTVKYKVVEVRVLPDTEASYIEVTEQKVAYGSDTRLNLYACSRSNGRPTSTKYRIVVSAVKV